MSMADVTDEKREVLHAQFSERKLQVKTVN